MHVEQLARHITYCFTGSKHNLRQELAYWYTYIKTLNQNVGGTTKQYYNMHSSEGLKIKVCKILAPHVWPRPSGAENRPAL